MAFKTLPVNPKKEQSGTTFQSSVTLDAASETHSKGTAAEQSTFVTPTAWGVAVGSGASIATMIVDDALVLLKNTKYGKYYDGTKLAIESAAGLVLNEGLEVSKDHENGGWSDGYLDFAEDVALTVGGNYVGGIVATAVLGAAAPALASAAVGVGIAALIGGSYSWIKDKLSNSTSEGDPKNLFPPSDFNGAIDPLVSGGRTNGDTSSRNPFGRDSLLPGHESSRRPSGNGTGSRGSQSSPAPSQVAQPASGDQPGSHPQQDQHEATTRQSRESQPGEITVREPAQDRSSSSAQPSSNGNSNSSDGPRWERTQGSAEFDDEDTGKTGTHGFEREVDKDGNPTGNWRILNDDGSPEGSVVFKDKDTDNDGTPDSHDKKPEDASQSMDNPERIGGSGSSAGQHEYLRGIQGEIDYGPDGKPGETYVGDRDFLTGFNPRVDYDQNGTPSQGYQGEHDSLINFDGTIDWGDSNSGNHEFSGNVLTDILGDINPRSSSFDFASADVASMLAPTDPLLV